MKTNNNATAKAATLNEKVYHSLREDIVSGRLTAGTKLLFAELHKRYSVGTSTLREALARLLSDNLVVGEGQKGFTVAPVSRADLLDITQLRCKLESSALRDAIAHGDYEWEASIVASHHRLSRFHQQARGVPPLLTEAGAELHRKFHLDLLAGCRSKWELRLIELLYDHSERYRRLSSIAQSQDRDSDAEHRAIVDATLARDADAAAKLLIDHIERTTLELTRVPGLFPPTD